MVCLIQEWIASGKPVNPPPSESGYKKKSPLEIAIEQGFHSLVKVLLGGGADINSVSMATVFETWQPDIMKWFIEQGADVEADTPLAYAFCERIRTPLGIFKSYRDRFPSFQEQANIALRHHCKEGNLKWVSLMLWAGADPESKGPYCRHEDPDLEYDRNALELAVFYEHFEIFNLKPIRMASPRPFANRGRPSFIAENETRLHRRVHLDHVQIQCKHS